MQNQVNALMRHRPTARFAGWTCLLAAVIALPLFATSADDPSPGQADRNDEKVTRFMRAKLAASRNVLEGLTTEDFDKIEQGARRMLVMSRATEWQVIGTETYGRHSADFRRDAERLIKKAEVKELDGAALVWMELTISCINCHKHVRSTQVAAIPTEAGRGGKRREHQPDDPGGRGRRRSGAAQ